MIKLTNIQFFGYNTNAITTKPIAKNKQSSTTAKQFTVQFDIQINKGEKVAIVGASGSGKSTLLNLIAGFIYANSGSIILNNQNHTSTKPHERPVSMLFQNNNLFNHLTVEGNIGLGLQPHLKFNNAQKKQIAQVANQVGLGNMLSRKPAELSGGQQQRVAIARCLLRDKPILLLDEPFSALDKPLRLEMMALLNDLCTQKKLTMVLVTHQPEELGTLVDRVITIENGKNI